MQKMQEEVLNLWAVAFGGGGGWSRKSPQQQQQQQQPAYSLR
jgi:hypothetical protein